jgi:hypothetical protein
LLFSDNTNNNIGDAIFNIIAEDKYIHQEIDLISLVGKNTYCRLESEVDVNDGILDIFFEEIIDSAFINAIIIDKIITNIGESKPHSIFDKFDLNQNYPNPFNPTTTISFSVKQKSTIKIVVYDIIGNEIITLVNKNYNPGNYSLNFNGSNYSSGVYI